jgi:carbon monoxide dehydrogenase subunit G
MQLRNSFSVPVPVAEAWPILLDVERVATCMPGATLTGASGDTYTGTVKVKLGPITVSYQGQARFVERDATAGRAVIEASGKESRGAGTAKATVVITLHDERDQTRVEILTDLAVSGKPAQFGRGVMADVSARLIDRFAAALAEEVRRDPLPPAAPPAPAGADQAASTGGASTGGGATPSGRVEPGGSAGAGGADPAPRPIPAPVPAPRSTPEAIDMLETAAGPILRRAILPLAVLAVGAIAIRMLRGRRNGRTAHPLRMGQHRSGRSPSVIATDPSGSLTVAFWLTGPAGRE